MIISNILLWAPKHHPMYYPLPRERRQLVSRLAVVDPACLPDTRGTPPPYPW